MAEPGKPNRANSGSAAGRLQQLSCDQWSILVPKVPFLVSASRQAMHGSSALSCEQRCRTLALCMSLFLGVAVFSANPVQDSLPARRCKAPLALCFLRGGRAINNP